MENELILKFKEILTVSVENFLANGGKLINRCYGQENSCCALTTLCYTTLCYRDPKFHFDSSINFFDSIFYELQKLFPKLNYQQISDMISGFIYGFDDRMLPSSEEELFKNFRELGTEFRLNYLSK